MTTLLTRLQSAEQGSREIDALVMVEFSDVPNANYYKLGACSPTGSHQDWRVDLVGETGTVRSFTPPHYTTNLQDAVDLVGRLLPDHDFFVETSKSGARCQIYDRNPNGEKCVGKSNAKTPALALICALCAALAGKEVGR